MARWVENILGFSLGLAPGERVAILCDRPLREAGEALASGAREMGAHAVRLIFLPGAAAPLAVVGRELVQAVGMADVLVSMRTFLDLRAEDPFMRAAMSAFRQAGKGRWASLAQVDPSVLHHELSADFGAVEAEALRLAEVLRRGSRVHLTTGAGTDLVIRYAGRPVHVETGRIRTRGMVCNLPAGEVFVAPEEESAEGRLVVDLCLGEIPLDQPVVLTFARGRVVRVEGGRAAEELRSRLGESEWAWTIGEFGLGANPHIRRRGRVAIDEKALGTAHIALGGNLAFGGKNPAETHYDCVVADARLEIW